MLNTYRAPSTTGLVSGRNFCMLHHIPKCSLERLDSNSGSMFEISLVQQCPRSIQSTFLIFCSETEFAWKKSHCQVPVAQWLAASLLADRSSNQTYGFESPFCILYWWFQRRARFPFPKNIEKLVNPSPISINSYSPSKRCNLVSSTVKNMFVSSRNI